MQEYLDVFDDQGNKTGKSETYENIHKLGLIHRTVHVWFLNSQKQILLQKRAKDKIAYPGLWDISVGGHISAGETSLEAAKRETKEELGLKLPDIAFTFLFSIRQPTLKHRETLIDNEFNDVYLVHSDIPVSDVKIQDDEIEQVRWIDISEFEIWIQSKNEPLVPHEKEYNRLLDYLKFS